MAENEVTPEMLAEQIRQLKIEDILLSTVSTLAQLAYAKLDGKRRRAGAAGDRRDRRRSSRRSKAALDEQVVRDFEQSLANLQLGLRGRGRRREPPELGHASGRPDSPDDGCADRVASRPAALCEPNGRRQAASPELCESRRPMDFFTDHPVLFALVCAGVAVGVRHLADRLAAPAARRQRAHARDRARRAGGRGGLPAPAVH